MPTSPNFPAEAWVSKIDASHHVDGRAYINVDQHRLDDFTPHVWRCDDYGAPIASICRPDLPQDDYTKVIREDPKNAGTCSTSAWSAASIVSLDAGDHLARSAPQPAARLGARHQDPPTR